MEYDDNKNKKSSSGGFWNLNFLPNAITCLNLFSGCAGVWLAFKGNYAGATVAILMSALFDFLDGMAARMLKAYSDIGKELDSLADVVSFGVVPGAIIFAMLSPDYVHSYSFIGFLIPIFSALRLAKFNIDERQTTSFLGLPTPANAIFWGGLSVSYSSWFSNNIYVLITLTIIFSVLLVAEIPMFSLKFKNLTWKDNQRQFIFILVSLFLIILLRINAIAPIILWYILLSIILIFVNKNKRMD